jgi:putative ABC transport system ATP-binding protein
LANGPGSARRQPTGNLDSRTSREIVGLLAGLNRESRLTVIMVSHEEALVREFAQEIVRLKDGRIVAAEGAA